MYSQSVITQTESAPALSDSYPADKTSTIAEVAARHSVSVTFIRNEIERGSLRAIVLAPNSHRKKVRILYRDELAWLESNASRPSK